jgi:antirestriction protein
MAWRSLSLTLTSNLFDSQWLRGESRLSSPPVLMFDFMTTNCTKKTSVWIGDLCDYNSGILRGRWFELDHYSTPESLLEEIRAMLDEADDLDTHEEWFIGDYDNIPLSGEYTPLESIIAAAQLVQQHGYQVAKAFFDLHGKDDCDSFEDVFVGSYDSLESYVQELINDCYDLPKMMGNLYIYFDFEALARDMELNGEVDAVPLKDGSVAIFRPR